MSMINGPFRNPHWYLTHDRCPTIGTVNTLSNILQDKWVREGVPGPTFRKMTILVTFQRELFGLEAVVKQPPEVVSKNPLSQNSDSGEHTFCTRGSIFCLETPNGRGKALTACLYSWGSWLSVIRDAQGWCLFNTTYEFCSRVCRSKSSQFWDLTRLVVICRGPRATRCVVVFV